MSDARLRELERRWQETGTVADEAAVLRERVRVGRLDRTRLEAAACIGSPAAQAALGGTPDGVAPLVFWWLGDDGKTGVPRWSRAIEALGDEASFRVGLALAWAHVDLAPEAFRSRFEALLRDLERELVERGSPPEREARPLPGSHLTPTFEELLWPALDSRAPELERRPWRRFWNIRCDGQVARDRVRAELVPWLLA
jgi:hypothetical protein